jgi:hypothetical protein
MDSQPRIARDTFAVFDPDRDLDDVLARIRSARVARVLGYWSNLRRGRKFPTRADVDPAEIKSALPHVMITAISYRPFRVLYRLVGTEIVHWARTDFTNRYADELVFDQDERDWTDYYRLVVEAGMPSYDIADWVEGGRSPMWVESAICPLSDDGQTIDRCLAVEDYEPMSVLEIEALPAVGERRVLVREKGSEQLQRSRRASNLTNL